MSFLYTIFEGPFAKKALDSVVLPNHISDNLKQGFGERPYQIESFKRFIYLYNEDFEGKPRKPFHLLYNMATGSGKTLVMAGLMLYLYEKGYRNFLFFVNSNNIITKTKDNFLNPQSSKYLFNTKIVIGGKEVYVKEADTFESSDDKNINIKFTTIQQLHLDLNNTKENSITYEEFKDKKIALIADEAHHLNSATKKGGDMFGSWENTVLEILHQNFENILLEFTATLDYKSNEIVGKYQDKIIFKYDLASFRKDKYSKEINLIRSEYNEPERILQAIILNLYRQELATDNNINLKPVILFKAKKTIKESEQNKANFHLLIDNLTPVQIEQISNTSSVPIVLKAFAYFASKNISVAEITSTLKSNFKVENCLSANESSKENLSKEESRSDALLNTLENENNPIRAVFAVQKLNEGWDVLNLFDIVRLYEGQNTGGSNKTVGATTLSEAQLIGRGARYYPFALQQGQDKYTRKYDDDINNDLKVLEELYYHTKDESKYISELKKALIETGAYEDEDNLETKQLRLKPDFKKTDFYKHGRVVYNEKIIKNYSKIKSFTDLGVKRKNIEYKLSSGAGSVSNFFTTEVEETVVEKTKTSAILISEIIKDKQHVVRYALNQNPFFHFDMLVKHFPNIDSLSQFIKSKDYLGGLEIDFIGTEKRLESITNNDYLQAIQSLLQAIELEIKNNTTEFEGSDYVKKYIHEVFRDKDIKVQKGSERADGQELLVANEPWYVYNANYGTREEKDFVKLFAKKFDSLNQKFKNIYLIRNEREVKIIDKQGRAFEPDFILFCKQKKGEELTYQVFIEPKGEHLIIYDNWKNEFLKEIGNESNTIKVDTDKYVITAVPFYNNNNENEFKRALEEVIKE